MNKTLTINLSGMVFHIDENAYDILRNYLEKLKRRFTGSSGEEIIHDIESRIAEMFQEKISPGKNIITQEDVNNVISIMGNPEDIANEAGQTSTGQTFDGPNAFLRKRFYRNIDDKILGGVCSGISSYFDIDPIWLRLAFAIITVILAGTGILFYIILWVIIPPAKTASEKLEMRGEPVNISNIEKNIKEEMQDVKDKLNKMGSQINSQETKKRVQNAADRVTGFIGDVVKYLLKFIVAIIGLIITILSVVILIGLTIVMFSVIGWIPNPHGNNLSPEFVHYVIAPQSLWLLIIGVVLLVGIPLIILLLNGIKLLFRIKMDMKKVGAVMLAFWLLGVGLCVWQGVTVGKQFRSRANSSRTGLLTPFSKKTIHLTSNKLTSGRFEWRDDNDEIEINGGVLSFTGRTDSVMCTNVRINIVQSHSDSVYLVRTFSSRGVSTDEARELTKDMNYADWVTDSSIVFNNAFNMLHDEKYRGQSVRLTLKIPIGYKLVLDKSLREINYDLGDVANTGDEDLLSHTLEMTKDGLKCLDCNGPNMKN